MSTTENPFASPHASSDFSVDPAMARKPVPASQNVRLINFLIDTVVIYALAFMAGVVLAFMWLAAGGELEGEGSAGFDVLAQLIGMIVVVSYFIVMEAATGRTLGKLVTGTKVVNEQGRTPTFGQILGRSFSRMIPFEPFSFLGNPSRGWHDTLSKTYVVKIR